MTSVLSDKKAGTARAGKGYYLTYTALFAVVYFFVFFWYIVLGKSFIQSGDGWYQNYRALLYYGQALRSMLRGFLKTGRLVFPHWDFALGEGADVVLNLHYYAVGDPLNLLAAFVPTAAMPVFSGALSLLRLYLSGLFFLMLCRQKKLESKWGVMAGALTYVFCCWGIWLAGFFSYFLTPMVYLPLILTGIEKIFAGERPYLLTASVCLAACSNFYYFYMLVILSVIWSVIRALCMLARHEAGWKALICTAAKVTGAAALGAALSAVLTLPLIHSFLQSPRSSTSSNVWMLFYPLSYYSQLPSILLGRGWTYDLFGGFSALSLLTALLLFRKKGNGELKAFLAVLAAFLLFPFFGKMMNGFSYAIQRWCWALSLGVALTMPVMWERLLALKRKDAAYLTAAAGVLLALCLLLEYSRRTDAFAGVALMFLCLLVLLVWPEGADFRERKQKALVLLTAASIGVNAFLMTAPIEGGYQSSEMVNLDYVNSHIEKNETLAVLEAAGEGDGSFFRYTGANLELNAGLNVGLSSSTYYWSTVIPSVSDYRTEMEELPYITHYYYDHNGRSVLNALSCARYYVQPSGYDGPVPYGYELLGDYDNGGYTVFENKNALPLGFTYEQSVGRQVWEQLSALEKQEAMLSAVYLDREEGITPPESLTLGSKALPCTVDPEGDGVSVQGNRFVVTSPGASVCLRFEGIPDCETYLVVKDVQFSGAPGYDLYLGDDTRDPQDAYSREAWEQMDPETRTELRREKFFFQQLGQVDLKANLPNRAAESVPVAGQNCAWYSGRDDFTVQLGYCREPEGQITLTFPENGIYTFGSLEVWGQSMEGFSQAIDRLREDSLQDVVIGDDTISGSISLDRPKILCLSIPYSEGWSALVDGEEAPLLRANVGYTALELDAGEHEILLRYHTPLMKAGAVISVLSFPALAAVVFFTERKKKRAALDGRRESAPTKSTRSNNRL